MSFFQAETLTIDIDGDLALLKIDVPGRSVNVFTPALLRDLGTALDRLANQTNLRVLVLRGQKPAGFLAGADIEQFARIHTPQEAEALSATGQQLFDKLELLPMASLAILHGPCLGGGLEVALACDYRLIVDTPGTQFGLPEVELGLLPGWGGTQRLPRIVGLERALQIILGGKRLSAIEAVQWGLADAIARNEAEQRTLLPPLLELARRKGKRRRHGLPLRTWRQKFLEWWGLGRGLIFRTARKQLERRAWDDFPAPREAFQAVHMGLKQGQQAGFAYERAAAGRLAVTPACHNLVNLFLQREKARKPAGLAAEPVRRVGIVGAGVMGAGIAQLAALRGCHVVVQEMNAEALGRGLLRINELFRKALERGVLSQADYEKRVSAVQGTTSWEDFANLDLVVEAATEDLLVKKSILRELENRTKPDAILATNTSSLPVAALQENRTHPDRVVGLHFFNPVHKMDLIEVVRGPATTESAIQRAQCWALSLGKTPIRVQDGPGFLVNRILMPYLNEAVLIVAEGLGIDEVDGTMKRFGMPMGPLALLDQVGLDVVAQIAAALAPALSERHTPHPAFQRLAASGWLGEKVGAGFYRHRRKRAKVNKDVLPLIREETPPSAALVKGLPAAVRRQQARERMVLLSVNEAAACLGDGNAATSQEIDLALILGAGWAPHRGGPLHYADSVGVAKVIETLRAFAQRFGPRYEPCTELVRRMESHFYPRMPDA